MDLETYIVDTIEGRRKTRGVKPLLKVLSTLFQAGVALRHWIYDTGLVKTVGVPLPVISVGNIVAGGTGKTPLIYLLAKELALCGKVAILSRGYRSKIEKENGIVNISKGDGPLYSSEVCGDEPHWLASQLPEAWLWVGKDRVFSAKEAHENGAQIILLDDGMQYRKLKRDFELVVMDAGDLFGKGHFLPRGYLRDSLNRLSRADLIVINHVKENSCFEECKKRISSYSSAPVVGMHMDLKDKEKLRDQKIGLFCAIGKPERFLEMVKNSGASVVQTLFAADHKKIEKEALYNFSLQCKSVGAAFLVCTEKDAVKIPKEWTFPLPIVPLSAELKIVTGSTHWNDFINKVQNHEQRRV